MCVLSSFFNGKDACVIHFYPSLMIKMIFELYRGAAAYNFSIFDNTFDLDGDILFYAKPVKPVTK